MKREELLKNAKPILFNTEMVKGILEYRKTVTRRLVKLPKWVKEEDKELNTFYFGTNDRGDSGVIDMQGLISYLHLNPFEVGDILYVRETWKPHDYTLIDGVWSCSIEYKVGDSLTRVFWKDGEDSIYENTNWKPSIHMPKEAARIFLKVTGVRVERLQDMYEEDAKKEGCISTAVLTPEGDDYFGLYAIDSFSQLWNSTINKQDLDSYGWEANPYVWVIEFERVEVEV